MDITVRDYRVFAERHATHKKSNTTLKFKITGDRRKQSETERMYPLEKGIFENFLLEGRRRTVSRCDKRLRW